MLDNKMSAIPTAIPSIEGPASSDALHMRPGVTNVGGIMEMRSLSQLIEDERAKAEKENQEPVIEGLAAHIRKCWQEAKQAKEQEIEGRLLSNLRQRRGEYEPDLFQALQAQGSATVYMMLTSNKCRSAAAWLREALGGMPWSCRPTPVAEIDDNSKETIEEAATQLVMEVQQYGVLPTLEEIKQFMLAARDQVFAKTQETAKERAERMTEKMKDQLHEGGFDDAMDAFIDDLVTFPVAILKGPVVRVRPQLKWSKDQNNNSVVEAEDAFRLEWERVDPFNIYPAPDATGVDDGYLIERHKLSRSDLVGLRSVEGYSEASINAALDDYGMGGLVENSRSDLVRMMAEGKGSNGYNNPSGHIDALQFWGSVQGKMLLDWGVSEEEVEDPLAEYHIEAWLVGRWVIKATINPDPLHRKPYYKTSWECVPGCFWGRSIPDLCKDTQTVCNAAARALVNNMSLASGPQVAYDVSRLPVGEDLSTMYPWKIWQFTDNMAGSTSQPITFFQPQSNAAELMSIYEKFATLADEYTGIPRYMTGDANVGGAGRTASGMSMLMSNAGKTIKNVVSSVDRILKPAIERLYFYNMMYLDDPELKGDVNIIAEGAAGMMMKEQQQQRQNEFFSVVASNPMVQQLIGQDGMIYILRELVKTLGMDTDKIIPALPIVKAKQALEQAKQAVAQQQTMANPMMAQQMQQMEQANGNPSSGGDALKPQNRFDQRQLMDGSPQSIASAV